MATNARWATRRVLREALQREDDLAGVTIDIGWLGEQMAREVIWFGSSTGPLNVPSFTGPDTDANPITYDDRFTIPLHLLAGAEGQSLDEAEDRLEVIYLAVERVVRTDPQLLEVANTAGLVSVLLADIVGPETFATLEGMASFADVTLQCHCHIFGGTT